MSYTYANNVRCALDSSGVDSTAVTFGLTTPSSPYSLPPSPTTISRLTLVDNLYAPTKLEIITYTGISGNTITGVTRGQEGTTAQAFATGYVYQAATAADYSAFSAAASITPPAILGTGSDTTFDSQDEMAITHTTLASASRFQRMAAVFEYTAGSSTSDTTMDFDYADIASYTLDTESPNATITPSATANTYQDYVLGTGTTATLQIGRLIAGTTNYRGAYQMFKGPSAMTGFTVYLGANTGSPSGDIGYKIIKVPLGDHYIHWNSCPVIASGQFTPTASATNTITFGSTVYLDDNFYALVFFSVSAQGADDTHYNMGIGTGTYDNAYGLNLLRIGAHNSIDGQPELVTLKNNSVVTTLTSGKINSGVTIDISGDYFYPSDIGKTVRGNSGHFIITGLPDICTGGTALSGAGTAANAFDGDLVTTSCAAGTNGYVGYDFGSSKTVRGVGVMFVDGTYGARGLDLVIEVSDDNFSTSTPVLDVAARIYKNRCFYYFDITSPTAGRYIRIRETGGAALTVLEMECYTGITAQTYLNLAAFANTSAITSGNWTLSGTGWLANTVNQEGGTSAVIAPVASTSYSTLDALATATSYGTLQFVSNATSSVEANIENAWQSYGRHICHLGSDKYAMVYMSASNTNAYAVIVSVDSSGVPTFGTPVAFILGGSANIDYADVCALSSTTFVIGLADKLWAATVSGTTITIGSSITNTANTYTSMSPCIVALDSTRFVSTGNLTTSIYPSSVCGSVSGTTITLGSKVDLGATGTGGVHVPCVKIGTDKVIACYLFGASSNTLRGKVLSISSTTISAGAEATVTFNNSAGSSTLRPDSIAQVTTDKAIIAAGYNSLVYKAQAVIASVSSTTITFGTATDVMFMGAATSQIVGGQVSVVPVSASLVYVGNRDIIYPCAISGTSITVGSIGQQNIGGPIALIKMAIGNSYAVLAENTYLASMRATVRSLKITAQSKILVGPAVSVSFNGTTYRVWNGSTYRDIASSLNSVHGGTNGVWYYRNSSSVWTAATTNTAIGALKQATVYSANCMSFDEAKAMSSANWTTMGFTEANPTTYFAMVWSNPDNTRYLLPNTIDQLTLTYTSRARWDQETHNYTINMGAEDRVTITKDTAGTKSIKAVVYGPQS